MKTPKREQEKCWRCGGDLVVRHGCSGSFCPTCNYYVNVSPRLMEQHARWIRKNRENRLKHALRRKENANRSLAEKLVRAYKLEQAYDSFIDKMLESYFEIGTFGQDVEGS